MELGGLIHADDLAGRRGHERGNPKLSVRFVSASIRYFDLIRHVRRPTKPSPAAAWEDPLSVAR